MGLKFKILLIIVCLRVCYSATAQETSVEITQDTTAVNYGEAVSDYIYVYKNRITANLFYVNTSNSLNIQDREASDNVLNLYPNKQDKIGVSVAFRSLAVAYSFSPNSMAENPDDKDSKLFNLNLRTYFGKHWMQTIDVYSQRGFYLDGHIDGQNSQVYLPNSKSLKFGGSTSYIFNENFSYRARANQTEKQLKSAGTFMPSVVYYYTKHNIIYDNELTGDRLVNSDFYSVNFTLAPSYIYNFVPTKNVFFSVGAAAGIGINYSSEKDINGDKDHLTSLATELNFSGTLTYDIDKFYLGAHYNYLIINHNTDSSSYIKDNIPYFQAFVGYRFKAPKKVVNTADDVNKSIDELTSSKS